MKTIIVLALAFIIISCTTTSPQYARGQKHDVAKSQ